MIINHLSFMELSAVGGKQAFPKNLARDGLKFISGSDDFYVDEKMKERALKVGLPQHGLNEDEIKEFISDYVQAAKNALEAGTDGISIAAGYGFLVNHFLDPLSNNRTDKYGGSIENISRFLLEVVDAIVDAIGPKKVAIRLSAQNKHGGMSGDSDPFNIAQYAHVIGELEKRGKEGKRLAFIDLIEPVDEGKFMPGAKTSVKLSILLYLSGKEILQEVVV